MRALRTPAQYVDAARLVLGALDEPWFGRLFLNPHVDSTPRVNQTVATLLESLESTCVEQAILLTHNATDTSWWQSAAEVSDAICFTRGRISFYDGGSPTNGQTFFYFGTDIDAFTNAFGVFGFVRRRRALQSAPTGAERNAAPVTVLSQRERIVTTGEPRRGSKRWFRDRTGHATGCVMCGAALAPVQFSEHCRPTVPAHRKFCSNACRQRGYRLRATS